MIKRYRVLNCEYNQVNYPELINKVFSHPQGNAIMEEIWQPS